MAGISYLDVFGLMLDRDCEGRIRPGDLVRTGFNYFPQFHVVAVDGETGWLRDVQSGAGHLVPLRRCRRIHDPALSIAAE